jgi:hypothetical protein
MLERGVRGPHEVRVGSIGTGSDLPDLGMPTRVLAGPMFSRAIPATIGATVERGGFVFTDVVPQFTDPAG